MSQTKAQLLEGKAANIEFSTGTAALPAITFTGDVNTGIYSPAADTIAFAEGGVESARIDSSGRLLVGTSTARSDFFGSTTSSQPVTVMTESVGAGTTGFARMGIVYNDNNANSSSFIIAKTRGTSPGSSTIVQSGDGLGDISWQGADGAKFLGAASIAAFVDGTPGANDMPGRLVFSTTADGASSPTERMRIHQGGQIGFGSYTGTNPVGDNATSAWFNGPTGVAYLGAVSEASLYVNRKTTDGIIVDIRQDGTSEGNISVSGNTVSYNQFLGAHWASLTDWSRPEIKIGTILETINELTDWKYAVIEVEGEQKKICYNGTAEIGSTVTVEYEAEEYEGIVDLETNPEFNKAVKVKVNDIAASKAIYGVFVGWNNDSNGDGGVWNDMYVGAVGNYVIRMAEGQEPEIGDLVEADGTGCAVVQDDDIIRTKTVAKITSTIPQVTYDDGSFLVTCVLYCG